MVCVSTLIGTPSWWSPCHRLASSNVRRPDITAPVEPASADTCPLTPSPIRSSSQLNSRPPSRPSSWPGRSSGPAMNPSTEMDMYSRIGVLLMGWVSLVRPVGGGDPVGVARRPLDELNPATVRVGDERGLQSVLGRLQWGDGLDPAA